MNEQMDGLAKAYFNHSRDLAPLTDILTHNEWYVRLTGTRIHKDLKKHVSQYLRAQAVRTLWTTTKHHQRQITPPRFTPSQLDLLDNSNIQKAWNRQRGCLKRFICKMATNQLATGRYMKRMKFWSSDKFPRCLQDNETTLHVLQCQAPGATHFFQELQQSLLDKLCQYPTKPELLEKITSMYDRVQAVSDWHPADYQLVVHTQIELPAHEFARGLIVQ